MEVVDIFATFFHIYRIPKLLNSIDEFQLVFCFDLPSQVHVFLQLMPKIFNGVYSQGIREVNVQPNEERHLKNVANEIWYPFLARRVRNWTAVVSSLATICMI